MKYLDYEKKIFKLAKFLHTAFLYRVAILVTAGVVATTTLSLVSTKGIVSNSTMFRQKYEYGETETANVKSFMGKGEFEYSKEGSGVWTNDFPKLVGRYLARPKSKNNFGSYYYGDMQSFQIVAKKVNLSVSQTSITYGDSFTLAKPTLAYSDTISSYNVNIENKEKTTWYVSPSVSSIIVTDSEGHDVSSCYSFTPISSSVKVFKKPLSITSDTVIKEYDGSPLSSEGYKITAGSLAKGDKLIPTADSSVSAINQVVSNKQKYKIVDSNNLDVTIHYDIKPTYGSLKITKRKLTFESSSKKYTYNGNKQGFTKNDVSLTSGNLLGNHTYSITQTSPYEFLKAGEYQNQFSVKILNGSTDVSEFYEITKTFGSTRIEPRKITIKSSNSSKTYDGNSLSNNNYEITSGSLVDKDKISITSTSSYKNAGTWENAQTYKIVDKNTNENFTSCYEITEVRGSLTISKRNISLALDKVEVVYDGHNHQNKINVTEGTLASGDSIVITNGLNPYTFGTYSNVDLEFDIRRSGASVKGNYNITFDEDSKTNSIVINRRSFSLKVLNRSKVYDGLTFTEMGAMATNAYQKLSGTLGYNDTIYFQYKNDSANYSPEPYKIQTEIIIKHSNGDNVTTSYDLTVEDDATFQIDRRPITIKTIDCEYEYDRKGAVPSGLKTFETTGLVSGHYVSGVTATCSEIDVGSYSYVFNHDNVKVYDANNNDVTNNYKFTFIDNGIAKIKPRKATITLNYQTKVYDGTPLTSEEYTSSRLLDGDYPVFTGLPQDTIDTYELTGVHVDNTPTNTQIFMRRSGQEDLDVTINYDLTVNSEELRVTQRPITLESAPLTKTFDGNPFNVSNLEDYISITSGSLANGDYLDFDHFTDVRAKSVYHVSEVENNSAGSFTPVIRRTRDGRDVTKNYKITTKFGKLTINPCPVSLSLKQDDVEYDGIEHNLPSTSYDVTSSSSKVYLHDDTPLPTSYFLKVGFNTIANIRDAYTYIFREGYTSNDFEPVLTFGTTNPSKTAERTDFVVSYFDMSRTIDRRKITISSMNCEKEYDGIAVPSNPTISMGSLADGHYIKYDPVDGIKAICQGLDNPIGTPHIFYKDTSNNEIEVTYNYDISFKYGKVTIYEKN